MNTLAEGPSVSPLTLSVWDESLPRLDRILFDLGLYTSVRQAKMAVNRGLWKLNGRSFVKAATLVERGSELSFEKPCSEGMIGILYDSPALMVVNKPSGLTSEQVAEMLKARLVHRLDQETSGAMLLAKSESAQASLEEQFFKRKIEKHYVADVELRRPWKGQRKQIWRNELKKVATSPRPRFACVEKNGKLAVTRCSLREMKGRRARLDLFPRTGRTHQLRVQCSHHGMPIVGDTLYGGSRTRGFMKLHAFRIRFEDPCSRQTTEVEAPLPLHFGNH